MVSQHAMPLIACCLFMHVQPNRHTSFVQGPEAGLPAPDLVLYLRMPNPEDAAKRGGFGNER